MDGRQGGRSLGSGALESQHRKHTVGYIVIHTTMKSTVQPSTFANHFLSNLRNLTLGAITSTLTRSPHAALLPESLLRLSLPKARVRVPTGRCYRRDTKFSIKPSGRTMIFGREMTSSWGGRKHVSAESSEIFRDVTPESCFCKLMHCNVVDTVGQGSAPNCKYNPEGPTCSAASTFSSARSHGR